MFGLAITVWDFYHDRETSHFRRAQIQTSPASEEAQNRAAGGFGAGPRV